MPYYRDIETKFYDARHKALVLGLLDLVRRQPRDLLALAEVRACLNIRGQRALGQQSVPLTHIIGSEGRYHDFDRRFLPRSDKMRARWSSVEQAIAEGRSLPPIDLYKIGDVYFVRDGNHRVSVARELGWTEIDAEIVELLVDVPLTPALSVRTLLLTQEYSDFLEWTNLHALRPSERIEFSELGSYLDLIRHINLHRHTLAQQHKREVSRDEAVASWYDTVYLPLVKVIRDWNMLVHFSGRTEADLYRWMVNQSHQLVPGIQVISASLSISPVSSERLVHWPWVEAVADALRQVLPRLRPAPDPPPEPPEHDAGQSGT